MQIGEFDQRIAIQSYTVEVDSNGQELPVWSTIKTVWSRVRYDRADEVTEGNELVAVSLVKFFIRYYPVTEVMRFCWENEYYRIVSVEEIGIKNYLAVRAEWKDSRWFNILRDTGNGIREIGGGDLRTVGLNSGVV